VTISPVVFAALAWGSIVLVAIVFCYEIVALARERTTR
jgi:hypothetical protein